MTLVVIIPVFNASRLVAETIQSIWAGTRLPDELIVVDDGSTDLSAHVAEELGARVLVMSRNSGPAACRNRAVLASQSEVLVFLDADTCVHEKTLALLEARLADDLELSAVIGSYDDKPRDPGLCSQFRNLAHCYVHHSANRNALTFWSGCGAIRRSAFIKAGGFDERYRRPSIEDIELGYRMSDAGARILLDPEITVTHTKRWTVRNSIKTDVMDRGIPWMTLLIERRRIPNDLNLRFHHRVAVVLTAGSVLSLAWAIATRSVVSGLVSTATAMIALSTDAGLLRFLYRKGGARVAAAGSAMTLVQNLCKLAATCGALLLFSLGSRRSARLKRGERCSAVMQRSQ